ncbi:unnamed protein product [Aphanomyces euteiches]|uniref:Uncharacterized protein n=1 Tax=Aphanomyces euteiches TaxID=100861 RepID=A0A6G0WVN9_9STRA|nr:hypothetical protein Ae201684_011164 [Aphanomyces euteiches]KAH9058488.1 hypothetical protein Ae201684P_005831 [Aphanomyces euteiches]KAH9114233.1 hypothetical protein AeMF1_011667 [Aphanomyces euteiches]KAH9132231.1 hypothetical protein LEN26_007482 [Aphanomyces euteiches]KAH9156993.1 hypothetical protein AeRB84_001152 [Aphanomyces euteiches]
MVVYEFLTKLPASQAIGVSLAAGTAASFVLWGGLRYSGPDYGGAAPGEPKTTSAEWQAATRDYMAAQKMNPISGFRK